MKDFPQDFKDMLHHLLGDEALLLLEELDKEPVCSVRINRRKPVAEFPEGIPVPWCRSGLYLDKRPEFIFDPLLHAGAYYVQDASSMVYETVVERLIEKFFSESRSGYNSLKVLDLCASPGGKTTAMINALPDGSEVIANEYTPKRVAALKENIDRWGYPHVKVTNRDSKFYAQQGEIFDIVAVDAPCSGEGMMRKEEVARTQWTPQLVAKCAFLQKEILDNAVQALKPGGILIYSTCTFNREENEKNAEYIRETLGLIPEDLNFPKEWGIKGGVRTDLPVYRFFPHVIRGEGLFLAVFRKSGEWIPDKDKGKFDKSKYGVREKETYPEVDVDKATALSYLRRESITLDKNAPLGFVTITYKGLPLGLAKNIGSRANNLYPKNRRILKR